MALTYLNAVDYAVIAIYVGGLTALGLYLKRKASSSLEDYLIGNRALPWWMLGVSGMAQYVDVAGTMVIVSFLFMLGPRGLFIEFRGGASLLLVIMLLWTGKWHRRSQCLTGAEWMIYRFGDGTAGRMAQLARAVTGIVMTFGLLAYMITGMGLFLSMFFPFTPVTCALGLCAAATVYTMVSGFYGVVFSDLFQGVVVIISAIVISAWAMGMVTDVDSLSALAESVTHNPQWTEASPRIETYMPPGYEQYQALLMIAVIYLCRNMVFGLGVGDDPLYFGAKSDKDCSKLTFLWICLLSVRWVLMIGIAVLGLFLVQDILPDAEQVRAAADLVHQHTSASEESWAATTSRIAHGTAAQPDELTTGLKSLFGDEWQSKLLLVGYHGAVNPERVMPAVLLFYFPPGLRGLVLVAILAAMMSGFNAIVNKTSGLFVLDIYQKHLRPQATVRELIVTAWVFIAALVGSGFLFALSVKSINDIWVWFIMCLGGGLVAPLVLRFYWWRFNGAGFAIGCGVGICAAIAQRFAGHFVPERWRYLTSEFWSLLILGVIGLVASIVAALLTSPTPEPVLRHFYLTTLPFGAWSRFKSLLPLPLRERVIAEHRRDIAAVPFALMFQVLIFLTPMLFVIHNWTSAAACGALAIAAYAGLYVVWLRHIDESDRIVAESRALAQDMLNSQNAAAN